MVQRCVEENASAALDQQDYRERYQRLVSGYEASERKLAGVEEKLRQRASRCETLRQFIAELEKRTDLIAAFDEAAWHALADRVTITAHRDAVFHFKSGAEVCIKLR